MIKIELTNINEESFVDEVVEKYDLNLNKKYLNIITDGAALNSGEYLLKAEIQISNWYLLKVIKRTSHNVVELIDPPQKFLTSIIEFIYNENEVKLTGTGYNCWIDWIFVKAKLEIFGEL